MGRVADPSRMSGFSAPHCGSLRASDEGRELELYGWVARRRDHGGLIFIDLRDRWGTVQVVFNPAHAPQAHTTASDLRSEFVVRVEAKAARLRSRAENARMPTGEVEVAASDLEVISVAKTPPFAIEDDVEADEALRLKFFFFQAEDGIRDYKVTGVQTCALPICFGGQLPRQPGRHFNSVSDAADARSALTHPRRWR